MTPRDRLSNKPFSVRWNAEATCGTVATDRASDYGTVNSPSIPSAKCGTPSGVSTKQANT
jgi:hypothetical protein